MFIPNLKLHNSSKHSSCIFVIFVIVDREKMKANNEPVVGAGSDGSNNVESVPLKSLKDDGGIENDETGIKLKPKITLVNGVTVIVGSIIGSGIFISPKGVLMEVRSVGLSLIVWLACGLFSMIGAYCYTELGTAIMRSGADYAYLYEAFGPFLAFLRLWVECMIVRPCSTAVVALTFANYVIEPLFPTCPQPEIAVRLLAALAISMLFTLYINNIIFHAKQNMILCQFYGFRSQGNLPVCPLSQKDISLVEL